MAFIEWTDDLNTGIGTCDRQHHKLVELINLLHEAMLAGKGKTVMHDLLRELVDYTVYHFETEEELFARHGYPDAPSHILEHRKLTQTAVELRDKVASGGRVITIDVMNFLKQWLNNHIIHTDKRYGPFLKVKGVK